MSDRERFRAWGEGTGRLVLFVPPASRLDERHDPLRELGSLLFVLNQVLHIHFHRHELPLASHLVRDQLWFTDDDLVILDNAFQLQR